MNGNAAGLSTRYATDDELSDEEDPRFLKQDDAEVMAAARQAPYFKRFDAFVDWIGEGAAR